MQIGNGVSGSINNTSNVTLDYDNVTLRFEPGGSMTFSKEISGRGKVECKGNGLYMTTFTGANTYGGTTTIESGTYFVIGPGGKVAGEIILKNGSILYFDRSGYTHSGVISGEGSVETLSTGKVILTGVNTYTGHTRVHFNGTLQIGDGNSGSINNTSGVTLTDANSTLRFEPGGGNMTFSKVITGKGKMECKSRVSGKLLFLTGDNTYEGTTTIDGDLYIGNHTSTGSVAGDIVFSTEGGLGTIHRAVFRRSNEYTYSGVISGKGDVQQQGSGKLILTGANTYTGQTLVRTTLQIGDGATGSIYNTSDVYFADPSAILRFEPGENMNFSKAITGDGKVEYRMAGGNLLYLSGENTYAGTTTVEVGRLYIGYGGTTGKITGDIILNNGTALYFYRSNEYTYAGKISGGGSVLKQGSGKTILSGVNTYTGTTFIDTGTLQIGNGNTGSIDNTPGVNTLSTGTLRFEPGAELTFPKYINGDGKLEYKGTAAKKLILTNENTYKGSTTVEDGILQISSNDNMINTSGVALTGANATLRFEPDEDMTFSKVISGSGKVEYKPINASKMLYFTGENTYTGTTTIEMGYFNIGDGGTKGKVSGNIINNGSLRFNRSDEYTYTGIISGTGQVIKMSSGKTILTGANTCTGTLALNLGSLEIPKWAGAFQQSSGTVLYVKGNVTIGGTLDMNGGAAHFDLSASPTSRLSATGALTKSGTNTLNITAIGSSSNYVLLSASSGVNTDNFVVIGSNGTMSATSTQLTFTAAAPFVAVTDVTGVPTTATAGTPLTLSGTIEPSNATRQTIAWSIDDAGDTGAVIAGETFLAAAAGTAVVRATIVEGRGDGEDYTDTFTIAVSVGADEFVAVTAIVGVPATAVVGEALTLVGTVEPSNATRRTIAWSIDDAGATGATITGATFLATAAGTAIVRATIAGGVANGEDFTDTFTITVTAAAVTGAEEIYVSPLRAWMRNGLLHVTGLTVDEVWNVYAVSGALVYTNIAGSEEADITLTARGMYIVKSGDRTVKVVNY